ncbi:MAG: MGMT family protein [Euryarchaeota archaeon]|nr:MGMT family protein [Euryarchaeota archaeon]
MGCRVTVEVEGRRVRRIVLGGPRAPGAGHPLLGDLRRSLHGGRVPGPWKLSRVPQKPGDFHRRWKPDLSPLTPFQRSVLRETARIPPGRVLTYGEVARRIGRPGAARAVGQALSRNPVPLLIPCHRVVASRGLGGFSCRAGPSDGAGGAARLSTKSEVGLRYKRRLLQLEGVEVPRRKRAKTGRQRPRGA